MPLTIQDRHLGDAIATKESNPHAMHEVTRSTAWCSYGVDSASTPKTRPINRLIGFLLADWHGPAKELGLVAADSKTVLCRINVEAYLYLSARSHPTSSGPGKGTVLQDGGVGSGLQSNKAASARTRILRARSAQSQLLLATPAVVRGLHHAQVAIALLVAGVDRARGVGDGRLGDTEADAGAGEDNSD